MGHAAMSSWSMYDFVVRATKLCLGFSIQSIPFTILPDFCQRVKFRHKHQHCPSCHACMPQISTNWLSVGHIFHRVFVVCVFSQPFKTWRRGAQLIECWSHFFIECWSCASSLSRWKHDGEAHTTKTQQHATNTQYNVPFSVSYRDDSHVILDTCGGVRPAKESHL